MLVLSNENLLLYKQSLREVAQNSLFLPQNETRKYQFTLGSVHDNNSA